MVFHHEGKHIPRGLAAKTVVELLIRMDRKGRGFFLMEKMKVDGDLKSG